MCCKLMEVPEFSKPRGVWCPHCDKKRGCTIYGARPPGCRIFHCGYLRIPHLDERWKPSKAKFLINFETVKNRVVLHVDPERPHAWREEPYYTEIKRWAAAAAREKGLVMVWVGPRATAVMPGLEKDLGIIPEDSFLQTVERPLPGGISYDCLVLAADDPRVTGTGNGVA